MTRTGRTRRRAARPILAVLAALALGNALSASTLPSRVYTTLEGLPGNHVGAITRDAHGYLWFATDRGLARFDGTRFTAFGRGDGLPDGAVNDVIETKDGALWVAADTGVYRLDPASGRGGAAPPFSAIRWQVARAPVPVVLAPRESGGIRVGTQDGVFDTKGNVLVPSDPVLPREFWDDHSVDALAQTTAGRWTGTLNTLWLEPRPAGTTRGFTVPDAPLGERISALLRDARGRLWIGTWQGLFRIEEGEVRDPLEPRNRVSTDPVESLFERDDGTVIAVSMHALTALRDGAPPVRTPAAELGALFEDVELRCAAEDTAGNLWIGTAGGGAIRLDREGFVRYGREDGLASSRAPAIFARRDGTPCAELVSRDRIFVACYDGARFRSVEPKPIRDRVVTGWGTSQLALEDTKG